MRAALRNESETANEVSLVPSATDPDWSREECSSWWQPSRRLLQTVRDYSRAKEVGGAVGWLLSKVAIARHRFWSVASGADIPLTACKISGGLMLPHPNGVVIHPEARLGPNCLLFQQVTIGTGPIPGLPHVGGHVDIGAGAKILGGVVIGDHAVIGANAVVISDVPAGAIATGVPALSKNRPVLQGGAEQHRVPQTALPGSIFAADGQTTSLSQPRSGQ